MQVFCFFFFDNTMVSDPTSLFIFLPFYCGICKSVVQVPHTLKQGLDFTVIQVSVTTW